jgi:hypothetical protein
VRACGGLQKHLTALPNLDPGSMKLQKDLRENGIISKETAYFDHWHLPESKGQIT